ncbi:MAG: glycoside hydrolase family 2 TIM barrel-domain containing protein [Paludibacter sp.]
MKKIIILTFLCFQFSYAGFASNPRVVESINENWRFSIGEFANASTNDFDDLKWENVSVPHTWNKTDAVDDTPGYFRGTGWYRKSVFIPTEKAGKQVFIYFEGANQESEVYVNGKLVGTHIGGYTRFCFDISSLVQYGQKNNLAIKLSNRVNDDVPPISADFTFFGGIYRDLYLIYTEKQHLATTHFASSGVFISTPKVSDNEAQVSIKTLVTNDDKLPSKLIIENSIISDKGQLINKVSTAIKVLPSTTQTIEQKELKVINPSLWSPDSPTLYKVITRIIDAKTKLLLDEVSNPLGLRWYEFSPDKGFFLNGKWTKLIGTCRVQDFQDMGNALPDEIHIRDIKLLKAMGANFVRLGHYPQDPTVLEMCDKLGIICAVEIPLNNQITETDAYTQNCLNVTREMVLQDYNRPSIMIWGYMNEVLLRLPFVNDSIRHKQYLNSVRELALKIENQIKADDPARYTMIPVHDFDRHAKAGITAIPQIIGFNTYFGWYVKTFDYLITTLNNAKKQAPDKSFILSEYGADVDPRLHSFQPERFDFTAEYANLFHESYIQSIMSKSYVAGAAIWNLNDFFSEKRLNAVPHVNNKGIVGPDRAIKDTYSQYQAFLSKTPVLAIGGANWKIRGGNLDKNNVCFQPVKVYSNQKSVELFLNGKSLGNKTVEANIAKFEVPFINGINVLDATTNTENGVIRDQEKIDFRAIPLSLKDSVQPFTEINVMLGSKRFFEDKKESVIWLPEKEYSAGSWGFVGGKPYIKQAMFGSQPASEFDIWGTTNDPVFQTARLGIEAFKMDVPDGKYTVCLYFAELQTNKEQQISIYNLGNDALKEDFAGRIFDVDINKTNVINGLNLTKEYGEARLVSKKFIVDVADNQGITVNFKKGTGEPILNAIRVYRNY